MKQKLYNIHKLIGINVALIFYISIFFGLLSIYKPYIHIWESPGKHFQSIEIEDINLNQCVGKLIKHHEKTHPEDDEHRNFTSINLPNIKFTANNSIAERDRDGIDLNPYTCEEIEHKDFEISSFFEDLHYGGIGNLLIRILFGFASVAVLFLCLSGIFMILKTKFPNKKAKTPKAFFAKYHRILLLYTVPLVVMFALTGALFNLGVYTSPIITNYMTNGETSDILSIEKNILVDKPLDIKNSKVEIKTKDMNELYLKAKNSFDDISFYRMEVYNFNDTNARVKFIGYEPNNYFVSSVYNETNIVLNAVNGEVISKKMADDGTFTEKLLDSVFYLHFVKTFNDLPRHIFVFMSLFILVGVTFSLTLWMNRAKKGSFSYKFLRPLSASIILGSLFGTALLFASTWILPMKYIYLQESLFYGSFVCLFIYILIQNNLYKTTKTVLISSAFLFIIALISHSLMSGFSPLKSYELGLKEVLIMDCALLLTFITLLLCAYCLPKAYFDSYNSTK